MMSALQMDFSTSSTRFQRLNSQSAKLSASPPSFPTTEEVAIDYSKSSNRMSPEGRNPLASPTSVRVPTKGMRKAYPEDQFSSSQNCQAHNQSKPNNKPQHPPTKSTTTASLDLPGKMEHSLYTHPSLHYPPGNSDHSPVSSYYPTPPPPPYNEHHHNRYNYNYEQHPNEENIREYQCLKCGLIFSRESDLHIHYSQDHGYGLGGNNGGGGNSAGGGSSTSSSSGSGSSNLHLLNRANQQQNNQQRNSNQQDMFCDKCQLRFHCLLSFRVHQHEHVLPNVQPHYPMSNSHLLSLSYSCEICGANFMSRESLTDHANAHLYEHVCSESTCGESDGATNSSEDFYQRAAGHLHQSLQQFQRGYLEMENEDNSPISHHHLSSQHNDFQNQLHHGHGRDNYEHQPGHKAEDSNMIVNQGPNIYSPEYSSQQYHHHSTPPEVSPPVSSSKTAAGGIYEPLIVMDNGKRRFQCVICKKYLSSRIAHEEHTRGKHTGDKPYSCSYCGKRFAVWNTYKHHVGTHKGGGGAAPLQKCSLCDKKFKTIECLRNHVQREHNNSGGETIGQDSTEGSEGNGGGYSCNLCGKTFVRKMWRTRHYLSHAGQNCFRCELCSCILPDEQSYRMHHESHKVSN